LILRPAQPADHEGAVEAWRAAQAGRGMRPPAARVARIREKLAEGLLVVAADGGGTVVGMALGEPGRQKDGDGEPEPELLHLAMTFVEPALQRQGVGAGLVEALADLGWANGYRRISVWTRTPEFYEACGLELSGRTQVLEDGSAAAHLTAELEAPMRQIVVRSDGIRLGQLLKLAELVDTGSEGKELLAAGEVEVNGEVELRRGRQMVNGDEVRARDQAIQVVLPLA
jgi:ribosome-associated protein